MPEDNWTEIKIHTTPEAVEAVANVLHEAGAGGVVIEDSNMLSVQWDSDLGEIYELTPEDYPQEGAFVKAYISDCHDVDMLVAKIKQKVNSFVGCGLDMGTLAVTITKVQEEDWATSWKQYYKPVQITGNVTVVPTWEDYLAGPDEIVIELDPGMAFGTGTHPTTRMCVADLQEHIKPSDTVYDVGCGSGVLAIAAIKLGAQKVIGFDIDPVAVSSAQSNIELNNLTEKIDLKLNNLLEGITQPVRVIVSNIIAEIIVKFTPEVYSLLTDDGVFICSGIIEQKKELVLDALQANNLKVISQRVEEGWVSIVAVKSEA